MYRALVNHEGQYSLWPDSLNVPEGWTTEHGPGPREDVVRYIDETWVDMRPRSLLQETDDAPG
jgi:MbtH protein